MVCTCAVATGVGAQTTLTPFARAKAQALIRDQLPCLGCHALDGEGGRLAPDLSRASTGGSVAFIDSIMRDPQGTRPGTMMPRTPMTPETASLVISYLVGRRVSSPLAPPPQPRPSSGERDAKALYGRFCAACHGTRGEGDGPNAKFLPVAPARHADSATMSARTDDRLFDAVYGGGVVLGRSNRMPAFGLTLSRSEIRGLVRYIRALCRCEGPTWSRAAGGRGGSR